MTTFDIVIDILRVCAYWQCLMMSQIAVCSFHGSKS